MNHSASADSAAQKQVELRRRYGAFGGTWQPPSVICCCSGAALDATLTYRLEAELRRTAIVAAALIAET
jgi:hypothetical protein